MLSPHRGVSDPERTSFDSPKIGSDRNFGILFAILFLVFGLWPVISGGPIHPWSLIVFGFFLAVAFFSPRFLAIPNKLWFRFGVLLGKVLTPIIMGVLFVAAIMPVALVLRLLGKDIIRLRSEPTLETYWLPKGPPGLTPGSLKDQF